MKPRLQILVSGLIWAGLSALSYFHSNAVIRAWIFAAIAFVFITSALVVPPLAKALQRGLGVLLNSVVTLIVWVILTLLYFLFITPMGLILRATGSLQTTKHADPSLPTYWVTRAPVAMTPQQYRRTF